MKLLPIFTFLISGVKLNSLCIYCLNTLVNLYIYFPLLFALQCTSIHSMGKWNGANSVSQDSFPYYSLIY